MHLQQLLEFELFLSDYEAAILYNKPNKAEFKPFVII
jgi:hypothetical protein